MKNGELTIFLSALSGESQNHLSINDCVRNRSRNADGFNISVFLRSSTIERGELSENL